MSIEVRIPKEITEYKEKIMFGLSIRQLICFVLTLVLCGTTYFVLAYVVKINEDLVGYLIIGEAMPLLAVGFIRKNGFTFEKYAALFIRHKTAIRTRPYKTSLLIDKIDEKNKKGGKYDWIFQKEAETGTSTPVNRKDRQKDAKKREFEVFAVTKENRKKQSKITKRKITEARKDYRAKKQGITKIS